MRLRLLAMALLLPSLALAAGKAPLVEVSPHDRAYFFTVRGSGGEQRLTLTSHAGHPLKLGEAVADSRWFHPRLKPVAPGTRWEVAIALDPATPAGRYEGTVTIATGDPAQPRVEIPVRALVEEVVSAVPAAVYFGTLRTASLGGDLGRKQVIVTRHRGKGFQVLEAKSDLPFLTLEVAPQESGKSYRIGIALVPAKVPKGKIEGTLTIRTNDPAFPRLTLPVRGTVL